MKDDPDSPVSVYVHYECVTLHSRLQLSSQTVPVSPERLSGPQRICPVRPPSASSSSGGPPALLPATTRETVSQVHFTSVSFHPNYFRFFCFYPTPFPTLAWFSVHCCSTVDLREVKSSVSVYSVLFSSVLFYSFYLHCFDSFKSYSSLLKILLNNKSHSQVKWIQKCNEHQISFIFKTFSNFQKNLWICLNDYL